MVLPLFASVSVTHELLFPGQMSTLFSPTVKPRPTVKGHHTIVYPQRISLYFANSLVRV